MTPSITRRFRFAACVGVLSGDTSDRSARWSPPPLPPQGSRRLPAGEFADRPTVSIIRAGR